MRKNLTLAILFSSLVSLFAGPAEQKYVDELNLARTQPAKYAVFIEQHRARFVDDMSYQVSGNVTMMTKEGKKAVNEAIDYLKKAKPIGKLTLSDALSKAAQDHTKDIGKAGIVGHDGTDGSTSTERMERHGEWQITCGENIAFGPSDPREVVMQLIIDDGVTNRGHRVNIFTGDYKVVGIAEGPHAKYGRMVTMDYAGGFTAKKK